jgi:hypothetical protein
MAGAVFQTWLPIVGGVVLLESTATAFKRRPLRELEQEVPQTEACPTSRSRRS